MTVSLSYQTNQVTSADGTRIGFRTLDCYAGLTNDVLLLGGSKGLPWIKPALAALDATIPQLHSRRAPRPRPRRHRRRRPRRKAGHGGPRTPRFFKA